MISFQFKISKRRKLILLVIIISLVSFVLIFLPIDSDTTTTAELVIDITPINPPKDWTELGRQARELKKIQTDRLERHLYPWIIDSTGKSAFHTSSFSLGKGIVFTGGSKHVPILQVATNNIRSLGCELPIEIWYNGPQDMSPENIALLQRLPKVSPRDLSNYIGDTGEIGWQLKPFAALLSNFSQVILADSDVLFFQSPDVFFESELYKSFGSLLFRDRSVEYGKWGYGPGAKSILNDLLDGNPPYYTNSRVLQSKSAMEIDSGVVVINKNRNLHALLLTCRMNLPPFKDDLYSKSYGDKESFWLAHEGVQEKFGITEVSGGVVGTVDTDGEGMPRICGPLYHPDENGAPLWINNGIGPREPIENGKVVRLQTWAVDSTDVDMEWTWNPACLLLKEHSNIVMGNLTIHELSVVKNMTELYNEFMLIHV